MSRDFAETEQVQPAQPISDTFLAAYLKAKEFVFTDHRRVKNQIIFFVPKSPELTKAIASFYDRTGMVSALTYAESFRTLRAFVHQTLELGGE